MRCPFASSRNRARGSSEPRIPRRLQATASERNPIRYPPIYPRESETRQAPRRICRSTRAQRIFGVDFDLRPCPPPSCSSAVRTRSSGEVRRESRLFRADAPVHGRRRAGMRVARTRRIIPSPRPHPRPRPRPDPLPLRAGHRVRRAPMQKGLRTARLRPAFIGKRAGERAQRSEGAG